MIEVVVDAKGNVSKHYSLPSTAKKTKTVSSSTGVPITPVSSSTEEVNAEITILVEQQKADKRTIRALQYNLSTLETAALSYIKQLKQENDAQKHELSMIQMVMSLEFDIFCFHLARTRICYGPRVVYGVNVSY